MAWARAGDSRYICVANVHVTMETHDSAEFRAVVNGADLVTPDGMPLVWALRAFGIRDATRVAGFDLTVAVLAAAEREGVAVGFHGGSRAALDGVLAYCRRVFPDLQVAYAHSPPFRPLSDAESTDIVEKINSTGARILFVGLGCPKQERWMATHRGNVRAVMLGVGAVFDFLSGTKPHAPRWMQSAGLEWVFRLASEPRRLWWRYAYHNPRFVALLAIQYARSVMA